MSKPTLSFWFEFASTYSYLTAGRIKSLAEKEGILIEWKPFLLGPIFKDQGMSDSPFNLFPTKGKYMWKDLERRTEKYGLPFSKPDTFPQNGLKAARITIANLDKPWVHHFILETYKVEFSQKQDISNVSVLSQILKSLGQNPENIISTSESDENKNKLRENTEQARKLGIFGAPSFIVNGELFWGDDRLEDAIEFLKSRS
ncbi:2-hydroxychromene-2-carboxylate isomerase [Leptospira hartskeerlii]|uniref:2-hydroxychromene-2-carboxylate isomerase n=1 Tax=Leptospira hartskeerlii TaxID=2023177 RepID=A0A2M9XCH8_9LEPT|nr:2-hydroxychromene-2-carboxylate isomerase [Leptospira hartskeerlii]PJZ25395.1 2-hydroxychromene-2-carboxylate isomerase [Leptospira hartskeerlii]PJZ32625.1 2-hydroxychromene-2-carboxylate isomerase [Leptospira hartskeerlii]